MRLDFTTDRGHFTGSWLVDTWELLQPLNITPMELINYRKGLGAFNQNIAVVVLPDSLDIDDFMEESVESIVRSTINVNVVQKGGLDEILYASCLRKMGSAKDEKIFVSLIPVVEESGVSSKNKLQIKVNADDAVMSAKVLDCLKRSLQNVINSSKA